MRGERDVSYDDMRSTSLHPGAGVQIPPRAFIFSKIKKKDKRIINTSGLLKCDSFSFQTFIFCFEE